VLIATPQETTNSGVVADLLESLQAHGNRPKTFLQRLTNSRQISKSIVEIQNVLAALKVSRERIADSRQKLKTLTAEIQNLRRDV
jgi:hypothetical protein